MIIFLWMLASGIVAYVLIMYGIIIFSFKETCRKETKNPYGKYSTGMYFAYKSFVAQKKGHGIEVKGTYEGTVPPFSGLVHIYTYDGQDVTALVRKSHSSNAEAGLRLFLPKKVEIDNIDKITTARKTFRLKEDEIPEEIIFPVYIRKNINDVVISLYILGLGMFSSALAIMAKRVFFVALGLMFLIFGLWMMSEAIFSKCKMDNENFVIIFGLKGKKEYPIRQIRVSTNKDEKNHFILNVINKDTNKTLCSFNDRSKNFNEMLGALRTSIERALYEDIYLPYMNKPLYVHATPEGRIAIATNDDGDKAILAYETVEADINPILEGYERKEMMLSEIVAECGNFNEVERIVIRSENTDYTNITKRTYETMLKYIV